MNKIKMRSEITSTTHQDFVLSCPPFFDISKDRQRYFIEGILETGDEVQIDAWKAIDAFLAGMCVLEEGVFSRVIWDTMKSTERIEWLSPRPNELRGTGISVQEMHIFDSSKLKYIKDAYEKIHSAAISDKQAFAVLSIYSVSNWFFNSQLIREAAINYFSVVEAISTIYMAKSKNKAVYVLNDILNVMQKLNIPEDYNQIIKDAYIARGELAHGHPKHLILAQHALNAHGVSSFSLKLPALTCKKAADIFLEYYFNLSKYYGPN